MAGIEVSTKCKAITILRKNEEYQKIKEEWLRLDLGPWFAFNFDEFSGISDYMEKLRKRFEELKQLKENKEE